MRGHKVRPEWYFESPDVEFPPKQEGVLTIEDIAAEVAEAIQCQNSEALKIVRATIGAMIEGLKRKEQVQIQNFGRFKFRTWKGRRLLNPKFKVWKWVPDKVRVHFDPAWSMQLWFMYPDGVPQGWKLTRHLRKNGQYRIWISISGMGRFYV
jgi:nucleoid DNA-binding protein